MVRSMFFPYMLVQQFLLRMSWRRAGNSSGSTASWHRVSACNPVSDLEVSTQLDLSAPLVEGIVACCNRRFKTMICSCVCIVVVRVACG